MPSDLWFSGQYVHEPLLRCMPGLQARQSIGCESAGSLAESGNLGLQIMGFIHWKLVPVCKLHMHAKVSNLGKSKLFG